MTVVKMVSEKVPVDIRNLSFEDALEQLEEIVRKLESGSEDLDGAIASYTRGVQLRRRCEERLTDAKAKIDKIVLKVDGEITSEPLEE